MKPLFILPFFPSTIPHALPFLYYLSFSPSFPPRFPPYFSFQIAIPTEHIDPHASQWLSDATLCRFLRARQWDVPKATAMLANTLKWRHEVKKICFKK